jgi:hypothetical protein
VLYAQPTLGTGIAFRAMEPPSGSYHLMARIELLSTATSTGRSLHDHVGLKVPGEAFLRL